MIPYETIVTAVSERADLFVPTVSSMLKHLDTPPTRLIVHEDVKGSAPGEIAAFLKTLDVPVTHLVTDPAEGLARSLLKLLHETKTPIIFHTQEDFDFVRDIPVQRALEVMQNSGIHYINFNQRKTMSSKHTGTPNQWDKVEKVIDGQVLTICDAWRFQASLWRVERILPAFERMKPPYKRPAHQANRWMNQHYARDINARDQELRHEKLKTYIWGGIAEPRFTIHRGTHRHSQGYGR